MKAVCDSLTERINYSKYCSILGSTSTNYLDSVSLHYIVGTAWIAGWGERGPYGNTSGVNFRMVEADNEINTNEKCNARLKEVGRPYIKLTDLFMCTNETNGKGACPGDMGVPLFLIKNESYMVQVGIYNTHPAYQFPCGEHNQVGVYMRISKYVGWIHRRISGCGNHPFNPATEIVDN